jgi:hypothetical protein
METLAFSALLRGANLTNCSSQEALMTLVNIAILAASFTLAQNSAALVPDTPTKVGDLLAVCTGVGLDARQNPAWTNYPLKIEVAGKGGQYLGDIRLTLAHEGNTLATLSCGGPWILLRLPPGRYDVEVETEGKTVSSAAFVPVTGQGRVILRFPELGGVIGPAPNTGPLPNGHQPLSQ